MLSSGSSKTVEMVPPAAPEINGANDVILVWSVEDNKENDDDGETSTGRGGNVGADAAP
jgi:hypothetical protein